MGLEGLSAAKQALIAVVVFGLVVGLCLFFVADAADAPGINKTAPQDVNGTFNKVREVQNITEDINQILLSQETSDINALQSMLTAGSSVIRLFKVIVTFPIAMLEDALTIFGIERGTPQGMLIIGAVASIVVILVLFMILRAIFSAGGGS